jgi:hypothetical protein
MQFRSFVRVAATLSLSRQPSHNGCHLAVAIRLFIYVEAWGLGIVKSICYPKSCRRRLVRRVHVER